MPTFILGSLSSQVEAQLTFSRIVFTTLTRVLLQSREFFRKWKLKLRVIKLALVVDSRVNLISGDHGLAVRHNQHHTRQTRLFRYLSWCGSQLKSPPR